MQSREKFPFLKHYVVTWPVVDIIQRYLANHRKHENAKRREAERAEGTNAGNTGGTAPAPADAAEDNYDDILLSD